jgi:hypothetical protein
LECYLFITVFVVMVFVDKLITTIFKRVDSERNSRTLYV